MIHFQRSPGAVSALVLSVVLPGLAACGGSQGATAARTGPRAVTVRTGTAQVQDVVYRIKAVGSLEAQEMVQVTAAVEGVVSQVMFNEGDHVTPETVLVRIDPDRYRLDYERAEATFKKAVADRDRAAAVFKRRQDLAREELVAAEELSSARAEFEQLDAEAEAARAARGLALQNQRRSELRPPAAGVINSKTVETGRFVQGGAVLGTLVDVSRLRLRFKVGESESLRAHKGQDVKFRISATGDKDFTATVYHVSDVADPTTRQVEVLAWVKNPGELKPGFFAEVTLASETRRGALVVPEGAVQASERGFIVYVVEDGKAVLKPIQIGLRTGTGVVEIVTGLVAGQVVVTEGSDRLADGVAVQPAGAAPAAGGGASAAAPQSAGGSR